MPDRTVILITTKGVSRAVPRDTAATKNKSVNVACDTRSVYDLIHCRLGGKSDLPSGFESVKLPATKYVGQPPTRLPIECCNDLSAKYEPKNTVEEGGGRG